MKSNFTMDLANGWSDSSCRYMGAWELVCEQAHALFNEAMCNVMSNVRKCQATCKLHILDRPDHALSDCLSIAV